MKIRREVFNGHWLPKLPRAQTRLENSIQRRESAYITYATRRAIVDERTRRHYSWIYDVPDLHKAVRSGDLRVTESELYSRYLDWVNDASITMLVDDVTGEIRRFLAPKRGNEAYSHRYRKRLSDLNKGLTGITLDEPLGRGKYRRCWAFLITLTYSHSSIEKQDAWNITSNEIAKFKVQLKRAVGASHIQTMTVREGTESGYPAPHMLVIFDRPMITFIHRNKHRLNSEIIRSRIKSAWKHGFVDIEGVVNQRIAGRGVVNYLLKYLTKAIDTKSRFGSIAMKTFAWQKLIGTRPLHVSKQLKDELTRRSARLDTQLPESQHQNLSHWHYYRSDRVPLGEYSKLLATPPPPIKRNYAPS